VFISALLTKFDLSDLLTHVPETNFKKLQILVRDSTDRKIQNCSLLNVIFSSLSTDVRYIHKYHLIRVISFSSTLSYSPLSQTISHQSRKPLKSILTNGRKTSDTFA
jgi:hypothetical protein